MNTILAELGHRVDFVETGEAAVEGGRARRLRRRADGRDAAGLDGLEATRRIRALPGEAGQRAGDRHFRPRRRSADEAAARAAGMNFYFIKPVSPAKLAQALAALSSPR